MFDFVVEAWGAVPEDPVVWSFRGCGISNTLYLSEEGDLHCGIADAGSTWAPGDHGVLQAKCCKLFFGTDLEEPFHGFESHD